MEDLLFEIYSGEVKIIVLGIFFNVRVYLEEELILISVIFGIVIFEEC